MRNKVLSWICLQIKHAFLIIKKNTVTHFLDAKYSDPYKGPCLQSLLGKNWNTTGYFS